MLQACCRERDREAADLFVFFFVVSPTGSGADRVGARRGEGRSVDSDSFAPQFEPAASNTNIQRNSSNGPAICEGFSYRSVVGDPTKLTSRRAVQLTQGRW